MALYFIPKYREKYPVLLIDDLTPLDELSSISEKMEKLTQLLEIPATEYNERRAVCSEVREVLRKYYPDCVLLMFGSSVNGFGFRNCDLDLLFLPFPGYCNLDHVHKKPVEEKVTIPEPSSILTGETSKTVLSKFDEWSHLKFIRTILRRDKNHPHLSVKKVSFIPAKSPTLKIYLSSNIICDVSCSNRLVVFNSELLAFYEKLDNRVKPLVMTLLFWARSLGFIKRTFFSSYAFTLLIIFFLQNTNPPILPSVEKLIEISGFSRLTAGWQTGFTTDENLVPKSKNTEKIDDLLIGFFQYYWDFDFVQYVVCPNSGEKLLLKNLKISDDERMADFEVSSVNIQDPFILSRNVCKCEAPKIVFKLALCTAFQMLQNKSEIKFRMLFDSSEYQKIFDLHYDKYLSGRPKVCFINLDYECAKFSEIWYDRASELVLHVLQYGLLIECEVTDKKINKDKKMEVVNLCADGNEKENNGKLSPPVKNMIDKSNCQNTPYDLELLLSIQCVLYSRTWIGRRNITGKEMDEIVFEDDDLEGFPSNLKAEYKISRQLVNKNPLLNSPVPLLCFKCDCFKHVSAQIADIVVMLRPLTLSREFYQVSAFLASYIPKTVKKILATD